MTSVSADPSSKRLSFVVLSVLVLAALIPVLLRRPASENRVVVYCSHDSIFADAVIRRFEDRTGIEVDVRYDEEANKSLGLTNLLIAERDNPRCDVFWNNQTLGTIRLKEHGVLASYSGPGYARIPAAFKDPDGLWAGFAARMRVYIINSNRLPLPANIVGNHAATEAFDLEAVESLLDGKSIDSVAIAIPLFGTTLSHYSVLAAEWGLDRLRAWHQSLHDRGIREARGNGGVKDLVAEGACTVGFTDTDDAFVALQQGKPVRMIPVRLPFSGDAAKDKPDRQRQTIVIPNSVALIAGAGHPQNAKAFIDFLLSEEVELLLANSTSRQIPLGPVDDTKLSDEVRRLMNWAKDGIPLQNAAGENQKVLNWLSSEYTVQ
ncbi:MAG: extracellular solute-binding protein [Planctomycetaceae bacterium]